MKRRHDVLLYLVNSIKLNVHIAYACARIFTATALHYEAELFFRCDSLCIKLHYRNDDKAVSGGAHCNPSFWGPSLSGSSGSV